MTAPESHKQYAKVATIDTFLRKNFRFIDVGGPEFHGIDEKTGLM
jgi:hypothetical protein